MLRRLYDWTMRHAGGPQAPWWLAVASFAEASFFPIPPDTMLAPMVLARPDRAWRYATICTLASVAGGAAGYAIGYFLDDVGRWLLSLMGHAGGLDSFRAWYDRWGVWVILIKGLTPIPYKLVTIASGLAAFSFPVFMVASVVTRGARFFLVAGLLKAFGPPIRDFVEKRLYAVTGAVALFIVLALVAVRYLGHGGG